MGTKLQIGNLPSSATEEDLSDKFKQFGIVESVRIIKSERAGASRLQGLVGMASDADARAAINGLNFTQFGDLTMSVSLARLDRDSLTDSIGNEVQLNVGD
jgi:RNA recognition motif-containing protein